MFLRKSTDGMMRFFRCKHSTVGYELRSTARAAPEKPSLPYEVENPSYPNRNLPSLQSELWKEMGWQGPDPSTDFRYAITYGFLPEVVAQMIGPQISSKNNVF
ncbi:ELMO domain-containing protein A-like protein [Cinnamomum micranthum f. kanehirae]|uniref:ELMO domain-containing protein A-like protein n=1 Tax=Cinnamomum micranthum f. kanehirae TaxID=337451 RepID=A0A443NME7_9MAGN|nr:ELMO domain-containing protein A-like protein [Cinnamomum micranthum f. kanehirae]